MFHLTDIDQIKAMMGEDTSMHEIYEMVRLMEFYYEVWF